MSVSRLTPAPTRTQPGLEVRGQDGVEAGGVDDPPAGALGGVAVGAAEATGDARGGRAASAAASSVVDVVGVGDPDHVGRARRRAAPARAAPAGWSGSRTGPTPAGHAARHT